jgi:signal transduction histidine kinase
MPGDQSEAGRRRRLPSLLFSLKVRLVVAMILLATVVIGLSGWWSVTTHRGHMLQATQDKVRALAEAVDSGIREAMREGRSREVQDILGHMAQDPDIEQIAILDARGRVLRASRPELVGQILDRDRLSRLLVQPDLTVTQHYEGGEPIQSVVKRIQNRPECFACHPREGQTIGILHLDMSARRTQEQIEEMERSAVWTVLLTAVVLAAGGALLMVRLVERPVAALMRKMAQVEGGDLATRADEGRGDELGRLAASFNAMVDRLQAAREEIETYHRHRLERSERLATLGELAASVAHEIKNPLAGIAGALRVLADDLPTSDPRREIMGEILAQIQRLDRTVRDLLTFARPSGPELVHCNVHTILDRVLLMLAEDPAAKGVRLIRQYQPDLPSVPVDGKQLEQVFFNLLLNAAQAMGGRGTITLTTGIRATGAAAEPHLEIQMTDTGPGIPAHQLGEVFTPFFTTKSRGIGLGLSISRRIIEDHGGRITAESPPGQGASLCVCLPLGGARGGGEGSHA